jgi:hypothetical protein
MNSLKCITSRYNAYIPRTNEGDGGIRYEESRREVSGGTW